MNEEITDEYRMELLKEAAETERASKELNMRFVDFFVLYPLAVLCVAVVLNGIFEIIKTGTLISIDGEVFVETIVFLIIIIFVINRRRR